MTTKGFDIPLQGSGSFGNGSLQDVTAQNVLTEVCKLLKGIGSAQWIIFSIVLD